MRTYATMLRNRPDFFIHCGDNIYADGAIAAEMKLANGEIWKNVVTEDKSKPAETLAEFRGNYKYNLLDTTYLHSTPRSQSSLNGTTTRSPTIGGRASHSRAQSIDASNISRRMRSCCRRAPAVPSTSTCRCARRRRNRPRISEDLLRSVA